MSIGGTDRTSAARQVGAVFVREEGRTCRALVGAKAAARARGGGARSRSGHTGRASPGAASAVVHATRLRVHHSEVRHVPFAVSPDEEGPADDPPGPLR